MSTNSLWVFAYGSLMWQPGFTPAETQRARLPGWHRAMCVLSVHYRGSPERPGLVLGLAKGGSCQGLAYRVEQGCEDTIRHMLIARELVTGVYEARSSPIVLEDGRRAKALAFTALTQHTQFAGNRSDPELSALIRQGTGIAGTSLDYLRNTIARLQQAGIRDRALERLLLKAENDLSP